MLEPWYMILNLNRFKEIQKLAPLGTGSQGPLLRVLDKGCLKMEQGGCEVITRIPGVGII